MEEFQKCVHVQDSNKVAYWRKNDALRLQDMGGGEIEAHAAGTYSIWKASDEGPVFDSVSEEDFNENYVIEQHLPEHMRDKLVDVPTYTEWVKLTRQSPDQQV